MENFNPTKYTLQCVATSREFADDGWLLDDREYKSPSLIRANYEKKQLEVGADEHGLYYPADKVEIKGNTIHLQSKNVKHPVRARYGWQPFTRANLVNGEELPASTFEIEVEE